MGRGGDASSDVTQKRSDFFYRDTSEPHRLRRKAILSAHPEIEQLQGNDIRVVPFVLAIMASQLALAWFQRTWSWPVVILVAWIYGGAANHALSLMGHELSHNLVFPTPKNPLFNLNEYFSILTNAVMAVPSATKFKKYHVEHHMFQGDHDKDTDLPTTWEGRFFTNTFLKAIWLFCQPLFYALRPGIVRPKANDSLDIFNAAFVIASNALVVHVMGWRALLYLLLSTLLGMGFHPVAGHFIAEHYVVHEGYSTKQETYSYYGPLNILCWNVGYHNEHHDFPKVPGWRLPEIKRIAPEFYDNLPQHKSWTMVLWNYVTDPAYGPFSRVIRQKGEGTEENVQEVALPGKGKSSSNIRGRSRSRGPTGKNKKN